MVFKVQCKNGHFWWLSLSLSFQLRNINRNKIFTKHKYDLSVFLTIHFIEHTSCQNVNILTFKVMMGGFYLARTSFLPSVLYHPLPISDVGFKDFAQLKCKLFNMSPIFAKWPMTSEPGQFTFKWPNTNNLSCIHSQH